jgi:ACT domain-containing protein
MKDLFHELVRVDENRSVCVEELPDGSFGVRGVSINFGDGVSTAAIRFSAEALEALTGILNRLRAVQEEKK